MEKARRFRLQVAVATTLLATARIEIGNVGTGGVIVGILLFAPDDAVFDKEIP
jgi:hypothetical protein